MNKKKNNLLWLVVVLWLRLVWPLSVYGQVESPVSLGAGQMVEATMTAGGAQRYQLTLASGAYLNLTVSYQGVIMDVSLNDPQGQSVAVRNGGSETRGTAEITFIAPEAGQYQLVLRGRGATASAGKYKLEIKELRAATETDRQVSGAQRLTQEANALLLLRTAAARQQALAKLREALPIWRASGVLKQELEVLRLLADTLYVLGEFRPAIELAQELLAKARAAGLRDWELKGLKYVGSLQSSLSDNQASRQTLEQALVLSRELHERLEERGILNGLGIASAALGQRYAAIEYYQEALKIAREIGDRSGEAAMLRNLAVRYESIGEPDKALEYFQTALALRRELGLRDTEGSTLLDLSRVQLRRSELQQALELATQARALLQAGGRKDDEAFALEHLSRIHSEMQEWALALDAVQQALAIYRSNNNQKQTANCLRLLSVIQGSTGKRQEAIDLLQQALTLHRRFGSPADLMTDLLYLGLESAARDEPRQALTHFSEALTLSREVNSIVGEAQAVLFASRAHAALGELDKAAALLEQALPLSRKAKSRLLEAETLHDLARLALRQQRFSEAQSPIEAALRIIEDSRSTLVNPANRADYRSSKQSYYELYLESLLRQYEQKREPRFAAQALEVAERARARSLLELLTEARFDIRQGVNTELLNRERALQQRLAAKAELLQRLSASKTGREQAAQTEAEIATLAAELREAESKIRVASPAYAALTQPQPLTLTELQQQVLDPQTLLLEYALGTERSYLFAVTSTGLKVFTLPARTVIETAARRFQELLNQRSQPPVFPNLTARQQWAAQLDDDTNAAALALSELLLQPAAAELRGKRLLIVPDAALHYVPFAALPVPSAARGTAKSKRSPVPLVVNHEIINLPSASTLAVLRHEMKDRAPAAKTLALFADPVFNTADDRLLALAKLGETASGSRTDVQTPRFERLPFTRQEAESIRQQVPEAECKVALDFDANYAAATSAELSQYRYVHFATHGLLNSTQPALSGLVLSQVDAQGAAQNGYLRTMDVYQLKLAADLVVLSGCRTALGKELASEGLVGLTRGFMYAGARRVVASLWQVNDAATAELMKHFYQGMLGRQPQTPAAALRAAQLQMLKNPRWRAPYYWAAFTLQGEW